MSDVAVLALCIVGVLVGAVLKIKLKLMLFDKKTCNAEESMEE